MPRVLILASLMIMCGAARSVQAHATTDPKHAKTGKADSGWAPGPPNDQVVDLAPGQSIKLSCLLGTHGLSLQVGDKRFDDFGFNFQDNDCSRLNDLKSSCISVTALATDTGYGLSFNGPFSATGKLAKDLTLTYSVTVTDPNYLISDLELKNSGSTCGSGYSSVIEKAFTDNTYQTKVAQLEVLNPGKPNPVFQDLVDLTAFRDKLFVEDDVLFGGGGWGSRNKGLLVKLDNIFSQSQIPEPSTMALSVAGLALLALVRNRKQS